MSKDISIILNPNCICGNNTYYADYNEHNTITCRKCGNKYKTNDRFEVYDDFEENREKYLKEI